MRSTRSRGRAEASPSTPGSSGKASAGGFFSRMRGKSPSPTAPSPQETSTVGNRVPRRRTNQPNCAPFADENRAPSLGCEVENHLVNATNCMDLRNRANNHDDGGIPGEKGLHETLGRTKRALESAQQEAHLERRERERLEREVQRLTHRTHELEQQLHRAMHALTRNFNVSCEDAKKILEESPVQLTPQQMRRQVLILERNLACFAHSAVNPETARQPPCFLVALLAESMPQILLQMQRG
eukprot:scaffold4564_cov369-Prasinococcus_capsulatus_cf.AAC.2